MSRVLLAEWTKLRTTNGPFWLLAGLVVATVGIGVAALAATRCPAGESCPVDTARLSLTGFQAGEAIVAVLAVLVVSTEYSTGMIGPTLAAMPRRWQVLATKAALAGASVLVAGCLAAGLSVLAGRILLPGHGFTAARGFAALSLASGPDLRAAAGSVLYLGLIAVLAAGVAAVLRDSAVATGVSLGLLYLTPLIAALIGSPLWQRRLERYAPTAGLSIQATTGLHDLAISPWAGLGVLALWAAGALLTGALALHQRDA